MGKAIDHPPHISIDLGVSAYKEQTKSNWLKIWGMIGLLLIFFIILASIIYIF